MNAPTSTSRPTTTPAATATPGTQAPTRSQQDLTPESAIARAEQARAAYVDQVRDDIADLDRQLAPLQAARDRLQNMLTGGAAPTVVQPRKRRTRRPKADAAA